MKLTTSVFACVVAAYLADGYYFEGLYFNAFRDVMYHIWHGY